jgi:hypothetical protein
LCVAQAGIALAAGGAARPDALPNTRAAAPRPPPTPARSLLSPTQETLEVLVRLNEGCCPPVVLAWGHARGLQELLRDKPGIRTYTKPVAVRGGGAAAGGGGGGGGVLCGCGGVCGRRRGRGRRAWA